MTSRAWGSRAFALMLAAALTTTGGALSTAQAEPGDNEPAQGQGKIKKAPRGDKIGEHDRQLLAEAVQQGKPTVTVMMATRSGAAKGVASSIKKLGGTVGSRNDRLGYVRATVPTASVTQAADLASVLKIDLNESIKRPDPRLGDKSGRDNASGSIPAPGPDTPDANSFMPTRETGAVVFKDEHPTFDGRGITIGILDSGVDLDHPALATTSTGGRKIVDWVTATDPVVDADPTWRPMLSKVTGPTFTFGGSTWTAPAGRFAINRFTELITADSEPGGDVNRDGDTTDRWGVLYDETTHDIWVDTDQDLDFTDEVKMRPYKEQFQVGHFGKDNPATAEVVETMPFVVEYREDVDLTPAGRPGEVADFVNIGIPEDAHGSHVAGITAAHGMFGGDMDGAAPGADIVSSRACTWGGGCTAVALAEGMIDLVVNRGVDVVNVSIGGLPALNDGANARAELYNRLIDEFGVQLFISAGNSGPGINTVGDPSVATDVVSVASSISKDTWRSNYGSVVSSMLNLHNFSSRGPREDGGFKPNVMAPGSAVSTVPQWLKQPGVTGVGYELPPGYAMFNGTSMASPQAAGAAALLLSAGRQTGISIKPTALRAAIYTGADFTGGLPALAQGNGQFDVNDAWSLLEGQPDVRAYTVSAPVCTEISNFLTTPDMGTGIYNRCAVGQGGQAPGTSADYVVTITRTSGPAGNVRHTLRWVGNDGTFSGPSSVRLALNTPVAITVRARPSAGLHSAILQVDDPRTPVVDHVMLATVVAPTTLSAPSYATSASGSVQRNLTESIFVTVPEGAKALQVDLSDVAEGSQTRFIAFHPYGIPIESTSSLECYTNFSDPLSCNPTSRSYANPLPGVWELEVESRRTTPTLDNPYTLTAAVQGVTVTPEVVVLDSVRTGVPSPVSWSVRNDFGPVTVHAAGGPLGSSLSRRPTIAHLATLEFEVVVPAGASRLDVSIGNPSDPGADLDLFVLLGDVEVGFDADGDSEESVSISDPAPGTYTVLVDGFDVPAGTTAFDYLDVFFSPELGNLAVPAATTALAPGGTTTVSGTVTANVSPATGRQLFGEMNVLSSEGAVLGTGSVRITSVTP